jgi:hypothetical protein
MVSLPVLNVGVKDFWGAKAIYFQKTTHIELYNHMYYAVWYNSVMIF